jgi:hypothetical protein
VSPSFFDSGAGEIERFIELLQVIDQKMWPRTVDRLHLADNSFLKIKSALAPPENFGHHRFTVERSENGMTYRAVLEVKLCAPTAGLESKPAATLAQTTHLQDFRRCELVQVAN